jgi:hypothetical protein
VVIPDPAFRQFLITSPDFGSCMVVTGSDILLDTDCAALQTAPMLCPALGIQSLQGVEYFVALTVLECNQNQLVSLNLSANMLLRKLNAMNNQLVQLMLPTSQTLEYLWVSYNPLGAINVSAYPNLKQLWCHDTQLTQLSVLSNPKLEELRCPHNYLTTLDLTQNPRLVWFSCINNQLTTLNLSANVGLKYVACTANNIVAFEQSLPDSLCTLLANGNPLTCLPNIPQGLGCTSGFYCDLGLIQCPGATISGRVYIDHNQSGTFDAGDAPLGNHPVSATLNGTLVQVQTNPMGNYELVTPQAGTVRVQAPIPVGGLAQTPLNWDTTFGVLASTVYPLSFRAVVDSAWKDLQLAPVSATSACVVRGQAWACAVQVNNNALAATFPRVRCSYSPGLEWLETSTLNATVLQHDSVTRNLDLLLNSIPSGGTDALTLHFTIAVPASQVQVTVQTLEPEPPQASSDNLVVFNALVCREQVAVQVGWAGGSVLPQQPNIRYYRTTNELTRTFTYVNTGSTPIQELVFTDTLPSAAAQAQPEVIQASHQVSIQRPSANVIRFGLVNPLPDSISLPFGHTGTLSYRLKTSETLPCDISWESSASVRTTDTLISPPSASRAIINPTPKVELEVVDFAPPQVILQAVVSPFADSILWRVGGSPEQQAVGAGPHVFSVSSVDSTVVSIIAVQGDCRSTFQQSLSATSLHDYLWPKPRVYPNPAKDLVTVIGLEPNWIEQLAVLDVTGRKVKTSIRSTGNPFVPNTVQLDLTAWPPGLYFLNLGPTCIPIFKQQ